MSRSEQLRELAERCLSGSGRDNALDVEIEVALFEPDGSYVAARSNAAGTKVVYTRSCGAQATHWAADWTANRAKAATELRALASQEGAEQ